MKPSASPAPAVVSEDLRRLEWHERVRRGDFVEDGRQGFEPWEGPAGFRADAFVKAIYRKLKESVAGAVKAR
jgi:hypothetical protein